MKRRLFLAVISAIVLVLLLVTLREKRRPENAHSEAQMADAQKQRVRDFWASYNRASALRTQGMWEEAVTSYRQALSLDPAHEDCLYYLGTCLYELGEYPEALATLRKMTEVNPASGRAWSQLGLMLSVVAPGARVDFEAARRAYLRNIELNREQAGPFLRLGLLDLNQGHTEAALKNFRIAAGFGSPEASYLVAYTLFLGRKDREALPYLRKVLEIYGRDKKITGKGVLSEGDVLPSPAKPLTALERAGLKSILLLYWISARSGGYPAGIPGEFHVKTPLQRPSPRSVAASGLLQPSPSTPAAGGKRSASADFDGDGRAERVEVDPAKGAPGSLRLLRKVGSHWLDRTLEAGLAAAGAAVDCAVGDYDRDGRPDLLVLFWKKGVRLYRNLSDGRFSDVTERSGLAAPGGASYSAIFLDYDQDGFLDVLVTAHAPYEDAARCLLDPRFRFTRNTPKLFRNRGNGTFEEVTKQVGLDRCYGTMQAIAGDFDGDGWLDLLLANGSLDAERLEPSVILRSQGGRKFTEWAFLPSFNAPSNAVGAAVRDSNHPGLPDIRLLANPILRGRGIRDGAFADAMPVGSPRRLSAQP